MAVVSKKETLVNPERRYVTPIKLDETDIGQTKSCRPLQSPAVSLFDIGTGEPFTVPIVVYVIGPIHRDSSLRETLLSSG
jgi:hypothetical protein